jgi:hypothetical protein
MQRYNDIDTFIDDAKKEEQAITEHCRNLKKRSAILQEQILCSIYQKEELLGSSK